LLLQLNQIHPTFLSDKAIGESEIWDHDLSFESPSSLIVWGPSGQGKSTLLRILFGLETRFDGTLMWEGLSVDRPAHQFWPTLRKEKLALVPQEFHLLEDSSGWGNLHALPQWDDEVDRDQLSEWAELLGIDSILDRDPRTWSMGQQQRFALLRALASPFQWLLLDEPVSHLDPDSAQKSLELMHSVCAARGAGWMMAQQTPDPLLPANHCIRV